MAEAQRASWTPFLDDETSPNRYQSSRQAPQMHAYKSSHDTDPLLNDLSPTKTLDVFLSGSDEEPRITSGENAFSTVSGIRTASTAERAFGIRVAQTARQLRAWCLELEGWNWPGTFEMPSTMQQAATKGRGNAMETAILATDMETESKMLEAENSQILGPQNYAADDWTNLYWGSLPAHEAQDLEKHVSDIQAQLDEMDIEELKNNVLDVHIPLRSRPSSTGGFEHAAALSSDQLRQLDDYTALVTATIMQALPYLSRLSRLLHIWSIRLTVSRRSSSYLSGLQDAQSALQIARSLVDVDGELDSPSAIFPRDSFNREVFDTIKDDLREKVTSLGQLLDSMLDDLEGREDTVPDRWIDEFETLEADYTNWVVGAGKHVLEIESRVPMASNEAQAQGASEPHLETSLEHSLELAETAEQAHDIKRDTLTEPLRIPAEKGINLGAESIPRPNRDYSSGAALSSHPPVDPPYAPRSTANAPELSHDAIKMITKSSTVQSDLRTLSSAASNSTLNSSPTDEERRAQISADQPEPKTFVSDPVLPITFSDHNGRRRLSTKLNALMGREERAPAMRPRKTPARPLERGNSGFGRLFSKQKESSDSAESSASESRQQSQNGPAKPKTKRSSLRSTRGATLLDPDEFAQEVLYELKASPEIKKPGNEENRAPTQSTGTEVGSPNSILRRDLSDIQRAADSLSTEQQSPSMEIREEFVAGPLIEPGQSRFAQVNWPLQSPAPPTDELEETFEPNMPVATDEFYDMFVDSLPTSPAEERGPSLRGLTHKVKRPGLKRRSLTSTAARSTNAEMSQSQPYLPPFLTKRHTIQGLTIPTSEKFRSIRTPGTNAEQAHAVLTDGSAPNQTRIRAVSSHYHGTAAGSRTNPFEALKDIPVKSSLEEQPSVLMTSEPVLGKERLEDSAKQGSDEVPFRRPLFKRASFASIESFPRSELKSVDIRRTDAQCSRGSRSVPQTPVSTPMDPCRPPLHHALSSESTSSQKEASSIPRRLSNATQTLSTTEEEELPSVRHISELMKSSPRRSGTTMSEQRPAQISSASEHPQKPSDTLLHTDGTPSKRAVKPSTRSTTHNRTFSEEEQLERQISSILTTIPARIRLTSRPAEDVFEPGSHVRTKRPALASGPLTPAKRRNSVETGSSNPITPSTDSPTSQPITLAPARPTAASRHSGGTPTHSESGSSPDTGVKLYHLIQPGRIDPIKLFVRLVGEDGSRVMVRVGGGWADLGDYLREFAQHHGRRTASGEGPSRVEMVGLDGRRTASGSVLTMPETGSGGKARGIGRAGSAWEVQRERAGSSASSTGIGSSSRPGSSGGASVSSMKLRPSPATGSQLANAVEMPSPRTPIPGLVPANATDSDELVKVKEKTPPSTESTRIRILEEEEDRVPLSGPSAKREMSAEKQRWVQDMLGQARKVSSERVERVGGTRRVVFRGLSNAGMESSTKE